MNPFKKALSKESTAGIIFTLPFTIGFLLFMIVPMGISLYYSFCKYDILSPPVFTGLDNFVKMFQDETFYKAIGVTFYFALVSVPLRLVFALIVAMLLLKNSKMSGCHLGFDSFGCMAVWILHADFFICVKADFKGAL